ncbi:MAG: slipin family protein [Armatimonadetes bacterium]|nr:slipin family protein [Armatimonadota bacterium]
MEALFGSSLFMIIIAVAIFGPMIVKVVQEWERGCIFQLGKYNRTRGPGLIFMLPFVEKMIKMDLRVITMEIPPQEIITKDNVTVKVTAVLYFRIVSPENAVIKVLDYIRATSQISQTTLRSILGQSELDELLSKREEINEKLQKIIDDQTEPWGIKVTVVEIKDVELPQTMQRAMAKQAEAEREKRAKIIHAEGEFQAAQRLADAAKVIASEPTTLQLRYLQTLTEIAVEKSSTILFPVPIDTLKPFLDIIKKNE